MAMYFFIQPKEKSAWDIALASERENVLASGDAELVTVLDMDCDFTRDMSSEELAAVKYRGPMYADFDCETIEEAIPHFQSFLNKLTEVGVKLDQIRMYATGGRGFHVEIPMACFMPKVPPTGVACLPHIYKEMAHALFVETLDLRVYSAKKGRMWRAPNKLRSNGKYKVGLTAQEAMSMTVEMYDRLCSSPRGALPIEAPVYSPKLGLLYQQGKDKIDAAVKNPKKRKGGGDNAGRFKGEWPETLKSILSGQNLRDGVGWNRLAMQLAIAADALGKTEDQLLTDAQGLLETYVGDSDRYGTMQKRKSELRNQYRYHAGNPSYEFSIGGILALVEKGVDTSDMTMGDYVPQEGEPTEEGEEQFACAISGRLKMDKSGIFAKEEFGYRRLSRVGVEEPVAMIDMQGQTMGYDVDIYVSNEKQRKPKPIFTNIFGSKSRFQEWTMSYSASMQGTDSQVAALADLLALKTKGADSKVTVVPREGIDLIVPAGAESEADFDVIWSSPTEVISLGTHRYRFRGLADPNGAFRSDLATAKEMVDTPESRALLDALFIMNSPVNIAKMLGWFSSTFLCQILRKIWREYPLLQVYGTAGSGKSKSVEVMSHLHYHMARPKMLQSAGNTPWPIIAAVTQSASIPVIFEEMKPREMSKTTKDLIMNVLRGNYTGTSIQRGALTTAAGPRELTVNEYENSGPVCFITEALESQAAIMERSVIVSMSKGSKGGTKAAYEHVYTNRTDLGTLGKCMLNMAMAIDYNAVKNELSRTKKEVDAVMGDQIEDGARPAHNLTIVIVGLRFLANTLRPIFNGHYDAKIEDMVNVLLDRIAESVPKNLSEVSRVLSSIASLTRSSEDVFRLDYGVDYTTNGMHVDLKLRPAYEKYVRHQRMLGMEVLFDNFESFVAAMTQYGGTVSYACPDNIALFDNPIEKIFRISCAVMDKEGVEPFRNIK